jgi:hypothetical protein
MRDDIEVQQQLLRDAQAGEEWVLRTDTGQITFEMGRAPRPLRADAQDALPDAFVRAVAEAADDAAGDGDGDADLEDLSLAEADVDPAAFSLGRDAVEALRDVLVAALDHDQLVDSEIREIVAVLPDEIFYEAAFEALDHGADTEGVESFRAV